MNNQFEKKLLQLVQSGNLVALRNIHDNQVGLKKYTNDLLNVALNAKQSEIIKWLIRLSPALINDIPLMSRLCIENLPQVVSWMKGLGAQFQVGETTLLTQLIVNESPLAAIQLAIQLGAEPNDSKALYYAAGNSNAEVFKYLLPFNTIKEEHYTLLSILTLRKYRVDDLAENTTSGCQLFLHWLSYCIDRKQLHQLMGVPLMPSRKSKLSSSSIVQLLHQPSAMEQLKGLVCENQDHLGYYLLKLQQIKHEEATLLTLSQAGSHDANALSEAYYL